MTDSECVDWLESHIGRSLSLHRTSGAEGIEIALIWMEGGVMRHSYGRDLREAVDLANGQ